MKTKIMIAFALVMIAAFTGYNVCKVQRTVLISDIALANVEALASVGEADSNTAYGYKMKNCYNKNGAIIGNTCERNYHQESVSILYLGYLQVIVIIIDLLNRIPVVEA